MQNLIIVTLVGLSLAGAADAKDSAYWKARVRAALAIGGDLQQLVPTPDPGPSVAPPPAAPVDQRPWVVVYCPDFPCKPCERLKKDAKAGLFPFRLIVRKASEAPEGFVLECFPTCHWNSSNGQGRRWPPLGNDRAYPGPEEFKAIWLQTETAR